jgi:dipeptidyl aminopeptidase/acylaminoacyl peptidase
MSAQTASAALPKLIPKKILFGNPEKAGAQISPDGLKISYLAPLEGVLNIWVRSVAGEDDRPVTRDKDRGIQIYFWSWSSGEIFYLQDAAGDENWRLYSVELESGKVKDLTPFKGVQVRIEALDKHFPDRMYLSMNREDVRVHDLYHLDLKSGELKLVLKNPGDHVGWLTDARFQVRGAHIYREDGEEELHVRETEASDWKPLVKWNTEDAAVSKPISFSRDGRSVYLKDSRDFNTARLVKMETATGQSEAVVEDPDYDLGGVLIHPDTHEIQMAFFEKERQDFVILDESIRADIEAIKKIHPGDFFLVNRDFADRRWVVGFVSDRGPVPFYLYERSTREAKFLFYNRPELNDYTLAPMEPVELRARDGVTLHGYLSFPAGVPRKNLPLVLDVHGGPWSRDAWGYDPDCQWLANRGYLCLQVNFRGSTGYGKKFVRIADKEWGGKMQDDLTDAVNWAVGQGYADPKRLAIYGGSYGGYAALAGAAFTPDLFRCAISVVGPSNLITFIQTIPPYWAVYRTLFRRKVGDPEKEADFLKSRSPLFRIDQIKIPILIAQGANDPRVKQAESEQIVEAMKKKGLDYEYLLFPDEGHGFVKPGNRLKFYEAAEKFLAKHLGGRAEEGAG